MTKPPLQEDFRGQVAIVTGATGGIGKEIARGLVRLGATVVVGGRSREKTDAVVAELRGEARAPAAVEAGLVDVSSMASVRAFAREITARHPAVHVLVNNAGAWFTDRRETSEGHELTLATNVLGPYALTKLLADPLRAAKGARVVNVVSELAAHYDASDLEWKARPFDGFKVYAQSKQALRMATWIQSAAFEKDGITVNAAAPGFVKSDFNQNARGFVPTMINLFASVMGVSPAEGADTPLWAAASREMAGKTACYVDKRKILDGKFRDRAALDDLARRLDAMTSVATARAETASV